jgi:hypothetical protein
MTLMTGAPRWRMRDSDPTRDAVHDQARLKMFRQYSIITQNTGICNLFVEFAVDRF